MQSASGPRHVLAEGRAGRRVRRVSFGSGVPLRRVGVSNRVGRAPSTGYATPQQQCQPPCLASLTATAVRTNMRQAAAAGRTIDVGLAKVQVASVVGARQQVLLILLLSSQSRHLPFGTENAMEELERNYEELRGLKVGGYCARQCLVSGVMDTAMPRQRNHGNHLSTLGFRTVWCHSSTLGSRPVRTGNYRFCRFAS